MRNVYENTILCKERSREMIIEICVIILIVQIIASFSIACDRGFYVNTKPYWFTFTFLLSVLLVLILIQSKKPTAMDVYQGKTTLEITYKNGVPVDSVVVWKGGLK